MVQSSLESALDESVKGVARLGTGGTLSAANCVSDTVIAPPQYIGHLVGEEHCTDEPLPHLVTGTRDNITLQGGCAGSMEDSDSPRHSIRVLAKQPALISLCTRQQFLNAYNNTELELAEDLAYACASCT